MSRSSLSKVRPGHVFLGILVGLWLAFHAWLAMPFLVPASTWRFEPIDVEGVAFGIYGQRGSALLVATDPNNQSGASCQAAGRDKSCMRTPRARGLEEGDRVSIRYLQPRSPFLINRILLSIRSKDGVLMDCATRLSELGMNTTENRRRYCL